MLQTCNTETVITILHESVGLPSGIANVEKLSWDELGIDSLGLTETVSTLERTLKITLPAEVAINTQNVEELVTWINSLL